MNFTTVDGWFCPEGHPTIRFKFSDEWAAYIDGDGKILAASFDQAKRICEERAAKEAKPQEGLKL